MHSLARRSLMAPAAILLALGLATCNDYDPNDYSPTAPPTADALTLTAAATSIPADGFSRTEITAQISAAAASDRRTVVFTTSAGTFVGATDNMGRSLSVLADTLGQAKVQLQSVQTIQTAIVGASVSAGGNVLVSKQISVSFVAVDASDLVRVSTSRASAPADGATPIRIFADIAAGIPTAQRTVTFTTTLGKFADSGTGTTTAPANADNRATVDLLSDPQAGQARVTATVASTTAQTTVEWTVALPETLIVTPDKASLKADLTDSTTVTVTLLRGTGTPTPGTVLSYKVVNPRNNNQDLGFIIRSITPSVITDDVATATAVILAGDTPFRDTATIVVSVPRTSVTGRANIEIVDP